MENERIRHLNGYIMAYKPDHFNTMHGENWEGWVYLHRYLMEIELGRELNNDEIVHHLDGNRSNNEYYNLIVIVSRSHHLRLHHWIDNGAKMHESYKPKELSHYGEEKPKCIVCQKPVGEYRNSYCSNECKGIDTCKVKNKPSKEDLIYLLENNSFLQVGKMFGVSDNAVRKWVKKFGIDPKMIRSKTTIPTNKPYNKIGAENVNAKKLNENDVRDIKLLYKHCLDNDLEFNKSKVAKHFGVTPHSIYDIIKEKSWEEVTIG